MEFEYDAGKSEANRSKHGIDFETAQELWQDARRVEIPAKTVDEARFVVIGRMAGQTWSAVVTYRGERVRIISVRRSRPEEIGIYEG